MLAGVGLAFCSAAAQAQSPEAGALHLYLTPRASSDAVLLTHIAEVRLHMEEGGGPVRFETSAVYRLLNDSDSAQAVTLRLHSAAGPIGELRRGALQEIRLRRNGQDLPLERLANGEYRTATDLGPQERVNLTLFYAAQSRSGYFVDVIYDTGPLRAWGRPPESMRVSVAADAAFDARTLLRILPAGYALEPGGANWHYENSWPWPDPQLRLLHASMQARIRRAEATGDSLALGRHLHALYVADLHAGGDRHDVLYQQALAALLQAVPGHGGLAHYSLARLYRARRDQAQGTSLALYLTEIMHHARQALHGLPDSEEAARADAARWLLEGLQLRIALAVRNADWTAVRTALTEAEQLPADLTSAEQLSSLERAAHLQQALWLLNQDSVEEAAALVEGENADSLPQPPAAAQALFQSLLVHVTAAGDFLEVDLQGSVAADQAQRLPARLETLQNLARGTGDGLDIDWELRESAEAGPARWELVLRTAVRDPRQARILADALGTDADWIVLQSILAAPWLRVSVQPRVLNRDITYVYDLDMGPAYSFWRAKGEALDQEAVDLASAGAGGPEDAILQYNYVNAAMDWRELASNTVILVTLQPEPGSGSDDAQVWLITQDSPRLQARAFRHETRPFALFLGIGGLMTAAGALSWLLQRTRQSRPAGRQPAAA